MRLSAQRLVQHFLKSLMDNNWHLQPPKGIGPKTVDLCIQGGLVKTKRVTIERRTRIETFFMPIRITKLGRIMYLKEQSRQTGKVTHELREHYLRELRKILGTGTVRSLQAGTAVFKVWRRTTPHNWWVENQKGEYVWHSGERGTPRPDLWRLFDLVEDSPNRIITGHPEIIGSDENAPEESTYRLKKLYCQ